MQWKIKWTIQTKQKMIIKRAQVSKKVYLNEAYLFITSYIVIFTKVNVDFSMKYGLP